MNKLKHAGNDKNRQYSEPAFNQIDMVSTTISAGEMLSGFGENIGGRFSNNGR